MTCSEKACPLPALANATLCRHHTLLLGGDEAFASHGVRGGVETLSDCERVRRKARATDARAVRAARTRLRRAHAGPRG